jgi:MFS family permease
MSQGQEMTEGAPTASREPIFGNIARLTVAQALAGANSVVIFATGAVLGAELAPSAALATLPISLFVVGMTLCTLPAGVIARRYGRRIAFLAGAGCGVLVGLLAALAMLTHAFWLFCLATTFGGAYAAVVLSFRFAAAEGVAPERRARALSIVMAGGVVAGVVGPQLVNHTMNLWPAEPYVITFLAQAAVALLSAVVLWGVNLPRPTAAQAAASGEGRPFLEIAAQPRFLVALTCGAVAYVVMNFLMTAAPLAMKICGLPPEASNLGIQWHVIAMYAPSFFTGALIARFGAPAVVAAGLALLGVSVAAALTGIDVAHFWLSLILLGLGWNLAFVGASTLVLECHRPEEAARVQSRYDMIVFGLVALGSFSSGGLLTAFGWTMVLWVSLLPLVVACVVLCGSPKRVAA